MHTINRFYLCQVVFVFEKWLAPVIRKWNSLLLHLYIGSLPLLHVTCIVVITCHYFSDTDCRSLVNDFSQFFSDKVHRIRNSIVANVHQLTGPVFTPRQHVGPALTEFSPVTADEVLKVLGSTRIKSSPLDLLPSSLLRESTGVFAPVLAHNYG